MADQPRRPRRSSISEHIHRVFNVDRPDKKRVSDGFAASQARSALVPKSEITIGFENVGGTAGETVPSSLTHSTVQSGLPSVSTPGSSPPVHPVRLNGDQQLASDSSTPVANTSTSTADIDRICSSPTWEKDINRKERRATKRLEAERKELEKRLSHLDEAQVKLEQGIYDRNSRRLTKKQPLTSTKRSSSANTERPRSSSFTSLFSLRSRSRASSVNGSDRDSRNSMENGPPTLPLTLPERFGTAVSRELATRHGTSLVPSNQMPRTLHHTTAKSDDLRENWKMAEAWKKKNGGTEPLHTRSMTNASTNIAMSTPNKPDATKRHTLTETYFSHKQEVPPLQYPRQNSQATELSADLDRDSFTAALRNERNPPAVASRLPNPDSTQNTAKPNRAPRNLFQSGNRPTSVPVVNTASQLSNNTSPAYQENVSSQSSPRSFQGPREIAAMTAASGNHSKKGRPGTDINAKTYKSSPLALNPFTNKEVNQNQPHSRTEGRARPSAPSGPVQMHSPEEQPERRMNTNGFKKSNVSNHPTAGHPSAPSRHSVASPSQQRPGEKFKEDWPTRTVSPDLKADQMSKDPKLSPLMVPPLKHSGRRSTPTGSPVRLETEGQPVVAEAPGSAPTPTQGPISEPTNVSDPVGSKHDPPRRVYQLTDDGPSNISGQSVDRPTQSRRSSHSSHGGSSYDTADEEVLDISKAHTKVHPQNGSSPNSPQASPSMPSQATSQNPGPNGTPNKATPAPAPRTIPPLARDGSISMIRQTPVQRTKKPQKDQVLAKLFVICCSCKYWHDMPSEIYARLACPERLPSESRLARTFSRKSSRRNPIFSSDAAGRGLSSPLRIQQGPNKGVGGENGGDIAKSERERHSGSAQAAPVQCQWCGHGMTRSCCQGWTTLVQMRDRHH